MGKFDEYRNMPHEKKSNRPEVLIEYENCYMKLLKRYENEIHEIENMMSALREERNRFYMEQLPAIKKAMEMDEVSPEIRSQWLAELQKNVEKSFKISEELIEHYVTRNLTEFKAAMQQEIKVV